MEYLRHNAVAWLERTNPLRGLSIARAGSIYDAARVQGSPRLQYIYNEIEATDPVLLTCVERRQSALAGLSRSFVAKPASDPTLADEQRDALERFAEGIDNFDETLERMDEAFFRGFVHLQPIWEGNAVAHVVPLNSWNFLRANDGTWLWNPNCHETVHGLDDVRGARLITLDRRRSIDWPALFIYIRKALGERDYGRFLERHGIPHSAIIMAPGTTEKDVGKYLAAAAAWANGQDMVLPSGSVNELATEARGADPFTPFIEHQDKYVVLLATGGTLTSLAQSDTGTLAGGAQMDVWREMVARDGVIIADALNRCLFRPFLERAFPGRPMAAEFRLSNVKKMSATEAADLAGKLKAAGWRVDQQQLEEATGFKLERDEGNQVVGESVVGSWSNRQANKAPSNQLPTTNQPTTILAAFANDTGPAAKAIEALLKDLEKVEKEGGGGERKELLDKFLADLPKLLPDDPAMAAVIAEEMAKQFSAGGAGAQSPSVPNTNKEGVCTSPNGPAGCKSPTCPGENDLSYLKDDQGEGLNDVEKQSLLKGHASIEKAIKDKCDVFDAMNDPELGTIDFRWDAHGFGIKHIIERRNAFRDNVDQNSISGEDMVRMLPSVIARGERKFVGKGLRRDVEIDFKGLHVVLTPSIRGKWTNHWVMTGYDINPKAAGYRK